MNLDECQKVYVIYLLKFSDELSEPKGYM